jgi:hypothetical protein
MPELLEDMRHDGVSSPRRWRALRALLDAQSALAGGAVLIGFGFDPSAVYLVLAAEEDAARGATGEDDDEDGPGERELLPV